MSLTPGGGRFDPFRVDFNWNPFEHSRFSFRSSLSIPHLTFPNETASFVNAKIDWKETPEAHVFKADLPGLKKEEVKVETEDKRFLCISGVKKVKKEEKADHWCRVECSSGNFVRRFRLPDNAKLDHVKASMVNGVLTVVVPKDGD
ncbi:Class I heat shock protein [Quillaja saponaria]|uniref:Class I heat shock protein n=1 Tax=Quillaja saponaria TaxID=32244 RepID=A0AAD7PNK3_QUISA|nr:Class I heat shock protein [Quillaja saponaria]